MSCVCTASGIPQSLDIFIHLLVLLKDVAGPFSFCSLFRLLSSSPFVINGVFPFFFLPTRVVCRYGCVSFLLFSIYIHLPSAVWLTDPLCFSLPLYPSSRFHSRRAAARQFLFLYTNTLPHSPHPTPTHPCNPGRPSCSRPGCSPWRRSKSSSCLPPFPFLLPVS